MGMFQAAQERVCTQLSASEGWPSLSGCTEADMVVADKRYLMAMW
jgi:hypothetical protein